jgi:uncharacterized protein
MRIDRIYRYPVKGLSAEALEAADLAAGGAIPWDRAFALAQGDAPFDPAAPKWIPKQNFMCLRSNARIAALRSSFDARRGTLSLLAPDGSSLEQSVLTESGRARIGAFLTAFLGEEARGTPRFLHVPGHVFGDQKTPVLSLLNLTSLGELEAKVGARREARRFRANIHFHAPAWSEMAWVGRELLIGGARLRVIKTILRCPATEVNPATAVRDANPLQELKTHFGHGEMGVHAEVIEAGRIAIGDAIALLPD